MYIKLHDFRINKVDESLDTIATMISYTHDIVYSRDNKCYTILQDSRNYIKR